MSITSAFQLFRILKERLGEKEAEALVEFVDAKMKDNNEANLKMLSTKEDVALAKADVIKWMFIFWVGQIAATFGLILLFIKK